MVSSYRSTRSSTCPEPGMPSHPARHPELPEAGDGVSPAVRFLIDQARLPCDLASFGCNYGRPTPALAARTPLWTMRSLLRNAVAAALLVHGRDRKSTRLNSSHVKI